MKLVRESGINLEIKPVLPMVMRGVPATRQKGMYIFKDAAREARAQGSYMVNFMIPLVIQYLKAMLCMLGQKLQEKEMTYLGASSTPPLQME